MVRLSAPFSTIASASRRIQRVKSGSSNARVRSNTFQGLCESKSVASKPRYDCKFKELVRKAGTIRGA